MASPRFRYGTVMLNAAHSTKHTHNHIQHTPKAFERTQNLPPHSHFLSTLASPRLTESSRNSKLTTAVCKHTEKETSDRVDSDIKDVALKRKEKIN